MNFDTIMQKPSLQKARMKIPLLFGMALLSLTLLALPQPSLADESIRTFTGHTSTIWSVAFSPDGRYALSGNGNSTLKLWDVVAGNELRTFTGHEDVVVSVAFSPDGRYALSGSMDSSLKLWDVATKNEIRTFRNHKSSVSSITFSPDGRYALSGSADRSLKLWEVTTGKEIRSFKGHKEFVSSVAFSLDGRYALSGSVNSPPKLWEVATGKEVRTFTGHTGGVQSVAFSPDGRYALSGGWGYALKLWEVATGKEVRTFTGHMGGVQSVAFSPDGRYALSGSWDSTLKLWEVETGKETRSFTGHKDAVLSVAFSPDGHYALSGSGDKTLKLWDLRPYIDTAFEKRSSQIMAVIEVAPGTYLNVYSEPSVANGKRIAKLKAGDTVPLLKETTFWFQVEYTKGKQGWINRTYASKTTPPDDMKMIAPFEALAEKVPSLSETTQPKDTSPPVVSITSHDMESGVAVVPKVPTILIAGRVEDESGIGELTVNGQNAFMDASGNFSAEVLLEAGETKVQIVARDQHGNTAWKNFWLKGVEVELPSQLAMIPEASNTEELEVKGAFHAIVIGINNYQKLQKLRTAINDAQAVDQILRENYGFSTHLLIDPDRDQMLEAFDQIRRKLSEDDHLLIYYAGHGVFDKGVDKAFWLPADADADSDIRWLIVDRITSTIKRMPAKHVLIVADSCYSGTLTRNISVQTNTVHAFNRYLGKMFERASRTLIASGGNEPVSDGGGSGHSVFAQAFLEALKNPGMKAFTAEQLFRDHLKERVAGFSQQIPEYKVIQDSGHEGGDFVFIRKP